MDFIGRTSELATLNAEFERGSGFVVIYGRRRDGKTTLIKVLTGRMPPDSGTVRLMKNLEERSSRFIFSAKCSSR